jgi:hypothetical protein
MQCLDRAGGTPRVVVVFAVLASALLLSACAQTGPVARAPEGDPIQAARELPDAPPAVRDGDTTDSCGEFVLDQGESLPSDAVQCLSAAVATDAIAELAWSFPTVEGDPIVSFAFVEDGSDEVTVFSTNAFDSYGGDPAWTKSSCSDPAIATSPTGCSAP